MTTTTRRRKLQERKFHWEFTLRDTRNGALYSSDSQDITLYGWQVTQSEGHRWPKGRHVSDVGGPFDTVKTRFQVIPASAGRASYREISAGVLDYNASADVIPYYGGVPGAFTNPSVAVEGLNSWVNEDLGSFDTDLVPVGTQFISSTIPTNPVVDGSVGLAELFREGLPSMIGVSALKERANFLRGLGSEYLNFEFGWKPLVSDLKSAAKAVIESEKILSDLAKHSGEDLRRRRLLPPERKTVLSGNNVTYPSHMPSGAWAAAPVFTIASTTVRQQWFSGCYTYHFEPDRLNAVSEVATKARLLYGLTINPEVLWNLAPWSWLVDWFANIGPVLHNVSSFQNDGLVLRYGYVMEKTTREYRRTNRVASPSGGLSNHPSVVTDVYSGTRKRRVKATPYGFGLNSAAFTNRQWAILGALGITQAPRLL